MPVKALRGEKLAEELNRLANLLEGKYKKEFLTSVLELSNDKNLKKLLDDIGKGTFNVGDSVDYQLDNVSINTVGMNDIARQAIANSASVTKQVMGLEGRFDVMSDAVIEATKNLNIQLSTNLTKNAKENLRSVIEEYAQGSISRQEAVKRIQLETGLLPQHAKAVKNYRKTLLDAGTPRAKANSLAESYAKRLLKYRANMIARTEVARATGIGQTNFWIQMKQQDMLPDTANRVWITSVDERSCDFCNSMNGQVATIDGGWDTAKGYLEYPQASHPHCRCSAGITMSKPTKSSSISKVEEIEWDTWLLLKGDYVGHPFRGNQWTKNRGAVVTAPQTPAGKLLNGNDFQIAQINWLLKQHSDFPPFRYNPKGSVESIEGEITEFLAQNAHLIKQVVSRKLADALEDVPDALIQQMRNEGGTKTGYLYETIAPTKYETYRTEDGSRLGDKITPNEMKVFATEEGQIALVTASEKAFSDRPKKKELINILSEGGQDPWRNPKFEEIVTKFVKDPANESAVLSLRTQAITTLADGAPQLLKDNGYIVAFNPNPNRGSDGTWSLLDGSAPSNSETGKLISRATPVDRLTSNRPINEGQELVTFRTEQIGKVSRLDREAVASELLRVWADSSGSPRSILMAQEAKRIFDTGGSFTKRDPVKNSVDITDAERMIIPKVVGKMYENTQKMFSDIGVAETVVYRGASTNSEKLINAASGTKAVPVEVESRPISSWSSHIGVATDFASNDYGKSYIASQRVDVKRILSTSLTGLGSASEREIIVFAPNYEKAKYSTNKPDIPKIVVSARVGQQGTEQILLKGLGVSSIVSRTEYKPIPKPPSAYAKKGKPKIVDDDPDASTVEAFLAGIPGVKNKKIKGVKVVAKPKLTPTAKALHDKKMKALFDSAVEIKIEKPSPKLKPYKGNTK